MFFRWIAQVDIYQPVTDMIVYVEMFAYKYL